MSQSPPQPQAEFIIRLATMADRDAVMALFLDVISTGDTYAFAPTMSRTEAETVWFPSYGHTFVAERDGEILGTYLLKANQSGLGDHVANAGYMVARAASSQGIGTALCRHSLIEARRLGFRAMQFNFVVSTNTRAVELWQRLGFDIVGRVPGAFRHATLGDVDTYVMHRWLDGSG
jgi:GNAT superfamily N-acetyltransferase